MRASSVHRIQPYLAFNILPHKPFAIGRNQVRPLLGVGQYFWSDGTRFPAIQVLKIDSPTVAIISLEKYLLPIWQPAEDTVLGDPVRGDALRLGCARGDDFK